MSVQQNFVWENSSDLAISYRSADGIKGKEARNLFKAKKISVPTEFSLESQLMLEWAVKQAKKTPDFSTEILHLLPDMVTASGPEGMGFDYLRLYEKEEKTVKKNFRNSSTGLSGTSVLPTR